MTFNLRSYIGVFETQCKIRGIETLSKVFTF